jgi:uncharacterized membrane protein
MSHPPLPAGRGMKLSVSALCLLVLAPFLALFLVDVVIPKNQCGTFGLACLAWTILISLAGWTLGFVLAIAAIYRKERKWIALPALILNALPLLAAVAAIIALNHR